MEKKTHLFCLQGLTILFLTSPFKMHKLKEATSMTL